MSVRTGEMYRDALRDGREVYVDGKQVDDLPSHPAMRPVVDTIARLYDLQHTPEYRDVLTWEGDDGERYSGAWIRPQSKHEGIWRRRFTQAVARETGAMFGRTPDFVAAAMLGVLDIKDAFSQGRADFADNIERFYEYGVENDVVMSHAFVSEQVDANKSIDETDVPRIVKEAEDGIVVRGIWTVGTFVPYSDECFFGTFPRPEQRDEHVLYFVIPVNTQGLRLVARPVLGLGSAFENPLGRYGDESDALLILDDVLVPWDRVLSYGNPSFAMRVFPKITEWVHWSILARVAVRAEMIVGLMALLPEVLGRAQTPFSMEAQGEALRYLATIQAFLYAAEERGHITTGGFWAPDRMFVTAGRAYATEHYRKMLNYIQDLGGQGLIQIPPEGALTNDVVGERLEHLFSTSTASAKERMLIYRLGYELSSSSLGGRQTLFELFNALPWNMQRQQLLMNADLEAFKELARAAAGLHSPEEVQAIASRVAKEAMSGDERELYDRVGGVLLERGGVVPEKEPA